MCHSPASTVGTLPSTHGLEMSTPCSNDASVNSPCLGVPFVGDIDEPISPDEHGQPWFAPSSLIQSVSSVSNDSGLPFDEEELGLTDEPRSQPCPLATPYPLKNELDAAGQGRRLSPESRSRKMLGLNLRVRNEGLPDLQALKVEDRVPSEVDF